MSRTNRGQSWRFMHWFTAILMSIFFFGCAVIMGWFGFQDMFRYTIYSVRLRAAAMIFVSLYFLLSAIAVVLVSAVLELRNRSAAAGVIVLIGGVASTVTGVMLLAYQSVRGDPTPWLWVWLIMGAGGVLVIVLLLQAGARFPYPKHFAVAVTVTSVLTGANFAYTSLYQPTAQPTQLKLEVDIGTSAFNARGTLASIPIKVSLVNTGKVDMRVVAAIYSVTGRRGSISGTDRTMPEMNLAVQEGLPASRRTVVSGYELLQTDRILGGPTVGAGDRYDITRTVELSSPTEYDAIALRAIALVVREEDAMIRESSTKSSWISSSGVHSVDAPPWVADPGADFECYEFPIGETSYLRGEARRKWVGSVWHVRENLFRRNPPESRIVYWFRPEGSPSSLTVDKKVVLRDNQDAEERYGLMLSDTRAHEKSAYEILRPR